MDTKIRLDDLEDRVRKLEALLDEIELGLRINNTSIQELLGEVEREKVKHASPHQ